MELTIPEWLRQQQAAAQEVTLRQTQTEPCGPDKPDEPLSTPAPEFPHAELTNEEQALSPRAFAAEWLRDLLQEPRWVEDVLQRAAEAGISLSTLKRAKRIIGAKSVKSGGYFGGTDTRWFWRLG